MYLLYKLKAEAERNFFPSSKTCHIRFTAPTYVNVILPYFTFSLTHIRMPQSIFHSLSHTSAPINSLSHTPPHLQGSSVRFSLMHDSSTPSSPLFFLSLAPLSSSVRIPTVPTFPLSEIDNLLSHQSLFNLLNQEDSYAQPLGVGLGDDDKEN
jgi:hypothetical protein